MKTVYDKYIPSHENYYIDKTTDLIKAAVRINKCARQINKWYSNVTMRDDLLNTYRGVGEDNDTSD